MTCFNELQLHITEIDCMKWKANAFFSFVAFCYVLNRVAVMVGYWLWISVTLTWRAILQSVQLLLGQTQYSDFEVHSLKNDYSRKLVGHFMMTREMHIIF